MALFTAPERPVEREWLPDGNSSFPLSPFLSFGIDTVVLSIIAVCVYVCVRVCAFFSKKALQFGFTFFSVLWRS